MNIYNERDLEYVYQTADNLLYRFDFSLEGIDKTLEKAVSKGHQSYILYSLAKIASTMGSKIAEKYFNMDKTYEPFNSSLIRDFFDFLDNGTSFKEVSIRQGGTPMAYRYRLGLIYLAFKDAEIHSDVLGAYINYLGSDALNLATNGSLVIRLCKISGEIEYLRNLLIFERGI